MIHSDPDTTIATMSTPKAKREDVVGVVRTGVEVQEEDQMDAHLRDREHAERDRDGRLPQERIVDQQERGGGQQQGNGQADHVAAHAGGKAAVCRRLVARCELPLPLAVLVRAHAATPMR